MIVIGAFFAQKAVDNGPLLDVTGGVWDYISVPDGEGQINPRIVILTQTSPDDYGRDHVVGVRASSPSGEDVGGFEYSPALDVIAENRYFHFEVPVYVRERGRYAFTIKMDGDVQLVFGLDIRTGA